MFDIMGFSTRDAILGLCFFSLIPGRRVGKEEGIGAPT